MPDKQVRNRSANARFVSDSLTSHRRSIVDGLVAHNAYLPTSQALDEQAIHRVLDWLSAVLEHRTSAMVAAEIEPEVEFSGDAVTALRRDKAVSPVAVAMSRLRVRVNAILGSDGLTLYGLRAPVPRTPESLLAYAEAAVEALHAHPRSLSDGLGGMFDTDVLARAVEDVLGPLRWTVRERLERERGEAPPENGSWHEVYHGVSSMVAGLFRLGGLHALARKVRPTPARMTGDEGPPTGLPMPSDSQRPAPNLGAPYAVRAEGSSRIGRADEHRASPAIRPSRDDAHVAGAAGGDAAPSLSATPSVLV
ncbi:hypothetical protein [Haliangium ochraceum]|uniref:Uncharacterized protein n=1 Tax=Haliangium ochraceum (strain DSM 14365 / JCM 11303 / SMP-2) TaxID=502025 RepID=D0LVD4_HALO1|nr:hypothetical protein [Haliangium ochraceum]ACY17495.1 hypothetical protein Hoch_5006 [Haliangium ochraceum DSM 14365]